MIHTIECNTEEKSVVVEQQPTLSLPNIYNQTTSSMTHLEKDPDRDHQFRSLYQLSSVLNPTDDCQEFPCGRGEKGVTPDAQLQRVDTDTMSTELLALLENPEIIEPLSLVVRKNQVERRIPVALKAPYPYTSDLLAFESHRREVVLPNQLQKIITPLVGVGGSSDLSSRCRVS